MTTLQRSGCCMAGLTIAAAQKAGGEVSDAVRLTSTYMDSSADSLWVSIVPPSVPRPDLLSLLQSSRLSRTHEPPLLRHNRVLPLAGVRLILEVTGCGISTAVGLCWMAVSGTSFTTQIAGREMGEQMTGEMTFHNDLKKKKKSLLCLLF